MVIGKKVQSFGRKKKSLQTSLSSIKTFFAIAIHKTFFLGGADGGGENQPGTERVKGFRGALYIQKINYERPIFYVAAAAPAFYGLDNHFEYMFMFKVRNQLWIFFFFKI